MGHQLSRPVATAAVILALTSCGGSEGDGAPPPVLDVAREQVADVRGIDPVSTDPAELPPPDPSSFTGAHRIVNLFAEPAGADGVPGSIDVWARRTFTHGPVLLADDVGFGEAVGFFTAPVGHRLVVVSSGAGPDADERASLPAADGDERLTTVFANGDDSAGAKVSHFHPSGSETGPPPPADGSGLVVLAAPNLAAFGDRLTAAVGGEEFFVGDGSASCRTQQIEATGAAAKVLSGAERVVLEVAPGRALVSLHPSPSPNGCDQPPAIEITVDVVAGETATVLVYTSDGTALEALTLVG